MILVPAMRRARSRHRVFGSAKSLRSWPSMEMPHAHRLTCHSRTQRLRQEDGFKLAASLGCRMKPCSIRTAAKAFLNVIPKCCQISLTCSSLCSQVWTWNTSYASYLIAVGRETERRRGEGKRGGAEGRLHQGKSMMLKNCC